VDLFRAAEQLLVGEEAPIVPIYFYAGFNYFDPAKIQGIHQNVLDEHPMQYIWKVKPSPSRPAQSGNAARAAASPALRPAPHDGI
jgi:oligopeptide transport system substrate-binding protein